MLITVILVMLVIGMLGAWIMGSLARSQASSGVDIVQARVALAARSGIEWGRARAHAGHCAASSSIVLDGISVTVSCALWDTEEDGAPVRVALLGAEAVNGSWERTDYVRRTAAGRVVLP